MMNLTKVYSRVWLMVLVMQLVIRLMEEEVIPHKEVIPLKEDIPHLEGILNPEGILRLHHMVMAIHHKDILRHRAATPLLAILLALILLVHIPDPLPHMLHTMEEGAAVWQECSLVVLPLQQQHMELIVSLVMAVMALMVAAFSPMVALLIMVVGMEESSSTVESSSKGSMGSTKGSTAACSAVANSRSGSDFSAITFRH